MAALVKKKGHEEGYLIDRFDASAQVLALNRLKFLSDIRGDIKKIGLSLT